MVNRLPQHVDDHRSGETSDRGNSSPDRFRLHIVSTAGLWQLNMKPSTAFELKRHAIRRIADRFHVANPRVFGSVLHGDDAEGSDLDLLVDPLPETTLLDLGGLQGELEDLLGVRVDVRTPNGLPEKFRATVLAEAQPV